MDFEPIEGEDFVFEEKIFGGSVPKNFHPAVEKGIREAMEHGVLAGYPMVGLKATLMDGKYHDVDSNELSFKMAAPAGAIRAGIPQANPVILEPVYSMKICVPDCNTGDVMGGHEQAPAAVFWEWSPRATAPRLSRQRFRRAKLPTTPSRCAR